MPEEVTKNPRYNSPFYAKNDDRQRELNLTTLDFFHLTFSQTNTEDQQFLDLGCGTGDFTRDWLFPRCPPCRRIVAVDASEDMLFYARQNSSHPSIVYDYLNIGNDVTAFIEKYGRFDRIYSFFCLNWLGDQAQAMKNVSSLLTASGECLLIFPAWSPTRMLWRKIAQLDRWKKFSHVFEGFVPKSQDLEDDDARLSYIEDILQSANLKPSTCELRYVQVDYTQPEHQIDMQLSLNPAASLVTQEERKILRNDVAEEVMKWTSSSIFASQPSIYIVHAKKAKAIKAMS